tara:strand:+ start:11727 stop:12740 length:1014 start_codon:yes stop_codon:yes gene_type:complete
MLGFKQFLTEVVGRNELKDIVFLSFSRTDAKSDNSSFMRQVLLPMSKKMSQRIFGERNRIRAAHITGEGYVDELVKMQGTQKSLACMTNPSDPKIWREGVATGGGIVFIVEGYPTMISNIDLYSRLDGQGRRYIPLASLLPSDSGAFSYNNEYLKMAGQLRKTIFKQIKEAQSNIMFKLVSSRMVKDNSNLVNHIMNSGFHNIPKLKIKEWGDWLGVDNRLYGQIIAFCIKEWFDEMEDIWKKNWRRLQYIFDPEFMSERKNTWDEINLVDIELIKCYPYSETAGDLWGDLETFDDEEDPYTGGVPIAGYLEVDMSEDEYSDEGWKTVRKIQSEIRQ